MKLQSKNYTVENLLWFRKHFPNVYHQLRNRQPDDKQVRVTEARNQQANIEVYVENNWVPLYSRYNPEQEAYRWAQQLRLDADELILIGIGCGYHLKALLELHPNIQVHLFELNDQLLLAGVQGGVFFELSSSRIRTMSVASCHDETFLHSANNFFQLILNRLLHQKIDILFVPTYQRMYQKEIGLITEVFKRLVSDQRSELHVHAGLEKLWTFNALKNLPYTIKTPSAGVLKEKVQGHPLIIVSSGPSLDKEVEVLKRYREKAVILAAGSSVNGLVHHDVLPHAVISYDPSPPNKKVFDLLATNNVQIPFIFGTTIYHEILSEYQYKNLFHVIISQDTVTPHVFQRLGINPEPIVSDAPSIAIVALQLAIYWGANPIIFVGQDLAFPDNKYYATGVSHLRDQQLTVEERKDYFEVEKVGGGKVLTSSGLNRMRENMEKVLKHVSQISSGFLFINTSPDGARIHGTVEMPLDKAITRYGTNNMDIDLWFREGSTQLDALHENEGKQYLNEVFSKQIELDTIVKELVEIYQRLQQKDQNNQFQKLLNRLDQLVNRLQNHLLFQIVYKPMMRTQLNLYIRMASQVRHQRDSEEKVRFIQQRLQGIIVTYYQIQALLKRQQFLPDSQPTIEKEKGTG